MEKVFVFLQHIAPQHLLSRIAGCFADSHVPWLKNLLIKQFIGHFNVNMDEALNSDYESYDTFNDFFTRQLKNNIRPIANDIVSPADGLISEIGKINHQTLVQAKGKHFNLAALLGGDKKSAELFSDGLFSTIYLSPKDYHRVHMPLEGTLSKTIYIPGKLFSVNLTTANSVSNLFSRNERLVCIFETELGPMAVILVGAMIVAGIETVWSGQVTPKSKTITSIEFSKSITLKKGAEMGRFKLGSTVIVLLPKAVAKWRCEESNQSIRLGETIGEMIH